MWNFLSPCQWRTEGGIGMFNPPPQFRRPSKIVPNSTRLWKLLKIAEFRTPTHQDVWKKGSKILKLPPVRNCFTLAMTNKLVVIINSLKSTKNEENVTIRNEIFCTKLQLPPEPLTRGPPPPDPRSLCPQLNLLNPPPGTKFLGTPLDAAVCRYLFTAKLLYMIRASFATIISTT